MSEIFDRITLSDEARGKRRMAWSVAGFLAVYSLLNGFLVWTSTTEFVVAALVSMHAAIAMGSIVLILGLMGLDATSAQIIPALKR